MAEDTWISCNLKLEFTRHSWKSSGRDTLLGMTVFPAASFRWTLGLALWTGGCAIDPGANAGSGGEGGASGSSGADSSSGAFVHGCLSGEDLCDGKCVHVEDDAAHCGVCDNACGVGPDGPGLCAQGKCIYTCNGVLVDDPNTCQNFFGAYEAFPAECAGCSTTNLSTADCSCPSPATEQDLLVQSDCPGIPIRSATNLRLCGTTSLSVNSDFGGAYQVDDLPGWCGAVNQCRVGNPLAGGACDCPAGFDKIAIRSILRLPCDNSEGGSLIVFCGNKSVPVKSFGGVFQVDDVDPSCRVGNPWTGGCSCPTNTKEQVFRVMVDGTAGLYGSTLRICIP